MSLVIKLGAVQSNMGEREPCGTIRMQDRGRQVTLAGWVHDIRDKGKLLFILLRDSSGKVQVTLEDGKESQNLFKVARSLGREYVITVIGEVQERFSQNPDMETGQIEVRPQSITVLNSALTPPFLIEDQTNGKEELRLRYRYLDLRRTITQRRLQLRAAVKRSVRTFLEKNRCLEVETPLLVRSTPEGARDFVVPSRTGDNRFFALPQSPQILKQLAIIGGIDRYYQIATCFRDEDMRADRQPEFSQIDCELAFVTMEEVMALCEALITTVFREVKGVELPPFSVFTYDEAIASYGTDAPDLRWGMPFHYLKEEVGNHHFSPWKGKEAIGAITIKGGARRSRKGRDKLNKALRSICPTLGSILFVTIDESGKPITTAASFFTESALERSAKKAKAQPGDLLLVLAGGQEELRKGLFTLRQEIIAEGNLTPTKAYAPLWVRDFPLFDRDRQGKIIGATHHPFTAPSDDYVDNLAAPEATSKAYDAIINGVELGGGSIRIHKRSLQEEVLRLLGMDQKRILSSFGFLLKALQFGAPPHGGFALGLDRLCLMVGGGDSIRDYIAFPKNSAGKDLMMEAPASLP